MSHAPSISQPSIEFNLPTQRKVIITQRPTIGCSSFTIQIDDNDPIEKIDLTTSHFKQGELRVIHEALGGNEAELAFGKHKAMSFAGDIYHLLDPV